MRFKKRLTILAALFGVLLAAEWIRVFHLSVVRGSDYAQRSEDRMRDLRFINTWRGPVTDRNGETLAHDRLSFDVSFSIAGLVSVDEEMAEVCRLLGIDEETAARFSRVTLKTVYGYWCCQPPIMRDALEDLMKEQFDGRLLARLDNYRDYSFSSGTSSYKFYESLDEEKRKHFRWKLTSLLRNRESPVLAELENGVLDLSLVAAEIRAAQIARGIDNLAGLFPATSPADIASLIAEKIVSKKVLDISSGNLFVNRKYTPLGLFESVPLSVAEDIEVANAKYHGFFVTNSLRREYPQGDSCPFVGYISYIPEEESDVYLEDFRTVGRFRVNDYRFSDVVGRFGLEKRYEGQLHGKRGWRWVETDASRRVHSVLEEQLPTPGKQIILCVDAALQKKAMELLGDSPGSIVVLDVRTGGILVLASMPTYNPNAYAPPVDADEVGRIALDSDNPLVCRAVSGVFPPGSVMKIAVAIAALEEGAITTETTFFCGGRTGRGTPAGHIHCTSQWGHGNVSLLTAIQKSCNEYFGQAAQRIGITKLAEWARAFGLGEANGFDIQGEIEGIVGTPEWKRATYGTRWYPGETEHISIGQGFIAVTPLQVANLMATVANGGTLYRPRFADAFLSHDGAFEEVPPTVVRRIEVSEATLATVRDGMRKVVLPGGTATHYGLAGLRAAGKTGTADVVSAERQDPEIIETKPHAWFAGFAPYDKPKIAFAVILEHGGHGGIEAARVAAELLETYYKLKEEDGGR